MFKFLPRCGKFSIIISLNMLSAPFSLSSPSGIPIMHRLFLLMMSYKSQGLSSLIYILSFLFLNCKISNNLSLSSLVLSSTWPSLMLKISIEFFSSIIVFFSSRFSVRFFFMFSICFYLYFFSKLNFSFCYCIVFLALWTCLSVFSWNSLSILWTIILNFFVWQFMYSHFFGVITGTFLFSFGVVMFPWFFMVPAASHRCLHVFRLHGLTSVRKDLYLQVEAHWNTLRP